MKYWFKSLVNRLFYSYNTSAIIIDEKRRESSIMRHNEIHDMYDRIIKELGDVSSYVSRTYIYDKIRKETGLSIRHIGRILNYTKKKDLHL